MRELLPDTSTWRPRNSRAGAAAYSFAVDRGPGVCPAISSRLALGSGRHDVMQPEGRASRYCGRMVQHTRQVHTVHDAAFSPMSRQLCQIVLLATLFPLFPASLKTTSGRDMGGLRGCRQPDSSHVCKQCSGAKLAARSKFCCLLWRCSRGVSLAAWPFYDHCVSPAAASPTSPCTRSRTLPRTKLPLPLPPFGSPLSQTFQHETHFPFTLHRLRLCSAVPSP